jgi:hypothetical protein
MITRRYTKERKKAMIDQALYNQMCSEFFPVFKQFAATEKYAITLGGSHGKGISDKSSDFDFRFYFEAPADRETLQHAYEQVTGLVLKWKDKGALVDGVWARSFAEIDGQLDQWLLGHGELMHMEWNVWGYNILTDIFNQQIIEDPFDIALQWKVRLSEYPDTLREEILKKYCSSLRYWRNDYHYINKVNREDTVFLASITARLVHDMMQVIYALNRFYFPGDGMNLKYTKSFSMKPARLEERIENALYPGKSDDIYHEQYTAVTSLIDEILTLAAY